MMIDSGDALTLVLKANLANTTQEAEIDLNGETEQLLKFVGPSLSESDGQLSFYGKYPIVQTLVPFSSVSAIGFIAKAIYIA